MSFVDEPGGRVPPREPEPPAEHRPDAGEPVTEVEISDVFDLHAFAPRDARAAAEAWLAEAHARGYKALRLIHGRGIGAQRAMVRRLLERTPYVAEFHDAPAEAGGWGATIITLR